MTSYALHERSLTIDSRVWPAAEFLVAEARPVTGVVRGGCLLLLCLVAPIVAMIWATLVTGPWLDLIRWPGAFVLGPGAIAAGLFLAERWPRPWTVAVEQRDRGYRFLPAQDQGAAQATAHAINDMVTV